MRTKREQVQAHRFIVRRIISAMLSGEPETLDLPMRRLAMATVASTAIAALVFAGFWVVGLVWPGGSQTWKENGAIIVEEETGARFVYWDGLLHPVQNYASALLITSSGERSVHSVHQSSLADTPRGGMLGISGAPDALPEADRFIASPWQTCSAPSRLDTLKRESHILVGADLANGTELGNSGLLVSNSGDTYLILGGTKFLVPSVKSLPALGADKEQVIKVDSVFINSLATGPDLVIEVPDMGDPGRELDGESYDIGSVFTNNDKYYVLLDDGLASIGQLSAELIGTEQIPVSTSEVGDNQSKTVVEPAGFPSDRPSVMSAMDSDQTAVCGVYEGGELRVALYSPVPDQIFDNVTMAPTGEADEVDTADHVMIPGGYGALVRAEPTPGAKGGTIFLVTDQGWKFGMTPEVLEAFGYSKLDPVPVPSALLALVPTGPDLSQAAALGFAQ